MRDTKLTYDDMVEAFLYYKDWIIPLLYYGNYNTIIESYAYFCVSWVGIGIASTGSSVDGISTSAPVTFGWETQLP